MKPSIPTALLQTGRFIAGLVAIWQIVGLLPLFTWLADLSAVTPHMAVMATVKIVVLLSFGFVYIFLTRRVMRRTTNSLTTTNLAPPDEAPSGSKSEVSASTAEAAWAVPSPVNLSVVPVLPPAIVISSEGATSTEEPLWAEAALEFEGTDRRPGLWAKLFAEAKGDFNVSKAAYLSQRFSELKELQRKVDAEHRVAEVATLREAAAERLAQEEKALAYLPDWAKGRCPNCEVLMLLSATRCQTCGVSFEGEAAWKPKPLPLA